MSKKQKASAVPQLSGLREAWRERIRVRVLKSIPTALGAAVLVFTGSAPAWAAPTSYPVVVGPRGVHIRSTLDLSSNDNVVAGAFAGDRVRVACVATGPAVSGPLGRTTLWDNIGQDKQGRERWLNDSFIKTGSRNSVAPMCSNTRTRKTSEGGVAGAAQPSPSLEEIKMVEVETQWNCDMMPTTRMYLTCKVHNDLGAEGRNVFRRSAIACVLGGSVTSSNQVAEKLVTKFRGGKISFPALAIGCVTSAAAANGIKITGVNDDDVPE